MKMKMKNIIIMGVSALLILAAVLGLTVPSLNAGLRKLVRWPVPTTYPYVFAHGLNGWGEGGFIDAEDAAVSANYWGGTACDLMEVLTGLGYECSAPSGQPAGSAWDRACELYAAITGTRVDYGKSHSEKFGHERYGETYTESLVAGWGEKDEDYNLRKINLIGHSFGGATVRLFAELMANGSEEEKAASPEGCSPLFTGKKADWIFSVTALTAPHNGTTLLYALEQPASLISKTINSVNNLFSGDGLLSGILGGLGLNSGEVFNSDNLNWIKNALNLSAMTDLNKESDSAYYDLTLKGADEINQRITTLGNSYYFSYPMDGTKNYSGLLLKGVVGDSNDMMMLLVPVATIIGTYKSNTVNSNYPINSEWLPNDGLVNTISAKAPFSEESVEFPEGNIWEIGKGVWNVMPVMRGDHGKPIGLMQDEAWTVSFYTEQLERIDDLSRLDTASWFWRREYKKTAGNNQQAKQTTSNTSVTAD